MGSDVRSLSGDNDGHGLATADRDRDVVDPDGDRIAADQALVQDLDPGALDEAELDQPALELDVRERRAGIPGGKVLDDAE